MSLKQEKDNNKELNRKIRHSGKKTREEGDKAAYKFALIGARTFFWFKELYMALMLTWSHDHSPTTTDPSPQH